MQAEIAKQPMSPERWQKIKRILDATTEFCGPHRDSWLEQACGGDSDLRREVESFLQHEDRLEGFIEQPVVEVLEKAEPPKDEPLETDEGRHIGPYRTERLLGRGGMGTVYLAVRQHPFEQQVALKVIRPGVLNDSMVRRFHRERQILAHLEHPYIARLLDGGTSSDGSPYFAMEYVDGLPIDRYCDLHRLPTRRRLELFLKVCSAIEFAHQNLVIHRDLKPGNILVDAAGTPKLLDFGIAKLLQPETPVNQAATLPGQRPMTLQYASPEQFLEKPITTASDIYSLGVLLYLILTGRLPGRLGRCSPPQLMQEVCYEDPPRPSEAVAETTDLKTAGGGTVELTPQAVSSTRDGDPRALRRRLAGDLDSIVLRALRKEPRHRYASVGELAEDIRRHLKGLPVRAREGTFTYRAGKFARRHRWGLASATVMVLLIVGFTAALIVQLDEITRARDRAEKVSEILVELFRSADPDMVASGGMTPREILDRGREELVESLKTEPRVRGKLMGNLGQVYLTLGEYDEANELLEEAVAILRLEFRGDHPELATAINDLATVYYHLGRNVDAEELYREAIDMRIRLGVEEDLIKPMNNLAAILMRRGELVEAERLYRESLTKRRENLGDDHSNVAQSLRSLGAVLYALRKHEEAQPLLLEALEIWRREYGEESHRVASALDILGRVQHERGRLDEAEALLTQALAIRRRVLGEDHLRTAESRRVLADLLLTREDTESAGILLTQALSTFYRVLSAEDDKVAATESLLGGYLTARGRYDEAEGCLNSSYERLLELQGEQAMQTQKAKRRLDELRAMRPSAQAPASAAR